MRYIFQNLIPCFLVGVCMSVYVRYSYKAYQEFTFKMDLLQQQVYKTTDELRHQLIFTLIGELVTYNALYALACWICAYIVNM